MNSFIAKVSFLKHATLLDKSKLQLLLKTFQEFHRNELYYVDGKRCSSSQLNFMSTLFFNTQSLCVLGRFFFNLTSHRHIYKYQDTCCTFLSITWFFSCRYINLNAIYSVWFDVQATFFVIRIKFEMIFWWWWEKPLTSWITTLKWK